MNFNSFVFPAPSQRKNKKQIENELIMVPIYHKNTQIKDLNRFNDEFESYHKLRSEFSSALTTQRQSKVA
jgi:hypothetical protein